MLETLVATLLNRYLGMYVSNFDPKQLQVGIYSGEVKLRNLELRREALDQLKQPINVKEGFLGALTLTMSFVDYKKPIKVLMEDVFLLVSPQEDAEYDDEDAKRRSQRVKMEKLDSAEMLKERNQEGLSEEEQKKSQTFMQSITTGIVNNLQVTIKNIHIRYEDAISDPGHPFALGFTLGEFSAVSTNGNWEPAYIEGKSDTVHKLAKLEALAVYWNTDSKLMGSGRQVDLPDAMPHDEMLDKFREMIIKGEKPNDTGHQYILKPVNGQAKLTLNNTGKLDRPKIKAGLLFDEIGLVLDDDQYRDALMLVDLFHFTSRHAQNNKYRPKDVTAKDDPKAWLQFAVEAILSKIQDRNRRWTWGYMKERRDDRIRYIELFKKKKQDPASMKANESDEINALELKLSYEDLRFWRTLARNQLRKENIGKPKAPPVKQQQGWIAWAWGSKSQEEQPDESLSLTEEERKKLYDAIDFDESTAIAESVDVPRETVKLEVEAELNVGSFALKRDIHGKPVEILSLYFDSFKSKVLQRPDSLLADVSLGGLRVNDGTTANNFYSQMVRVKEDSKKEQALIDVSDSDNVVEPFFQLQFEKNPLDRSADLALTAKLKSIEIIYNPNFVVEIVRFFKPPERHMDSIYALLDTAGATVESLRQQSRAGLEFALQEHKTLNAKLDLQAPLIIIPEDIEHKESVCLIVDAGHISVNSKLVDDATRKRIQENQGQLYSDEDWESLQRAMYDKFELDLEDTQVLIGPSVTETREHLSGDEKKYHLVDRINIKFLVEITIVPKDPRLPKIRVSGSLPVLHASVSDLKYKCLMRVINVAIPKFDDETAVEDVIVDSGLGAKPADRTPKEIAKRPRTQSSVSQRRKSQRMSYQFTTQKAIIVDDDEQEDEADYQDASDGQTDARIKMQQENFKLSFEIETLKGSLFQSDPERKKPDRLLVELVAQGFSVGVTVRPFDLGVEVELRSLSLDDHVEKNPQPEFKKLVSSTDTTEKALVHVKLMKVNRKSPEFMQTYEGIETTIDGSVSAIELIVTRRTLLTLLDFILITFTNPGDSNNTARPVIEEDSEEGAAAEEVDNSLKKADPEKLRIKVNLKKISLILNNDGIRLATLSLMAADLGIFLNGKTMRIFAKLGDLSLVDDVDQGAPAASRELVSIQGAELADFTYETFDPESGDAYPGYDSLIGLQAGSIKVKFLSEPFRKIIDFLVKFGKMQAIFNAARMAAANSASQIQQNASKIRFDITIRTPIIVFPRVMVAGIAKRDLVTAYLGEIYAQNKFVPLDDSKNSPTAMKLSAGIRNIRLTSDFFFPDEKSEELEMIDKVDLGFSITHAEHIEGVKRPDTEIIGNMTDFNLRITQAQMKFLLELSKSVPAAFAGDPEQSNPGAIEETPSQIVAKANVTPSPDRGEKADALVDLGPELHLHSKNWVKLDLIFKVETIGLEMILAKEDEPVGDLEASSLSKFSLDDTTVKLRMISDGSVESEFTIHSFTIQDSRSREGNRFKKVMTSLNKDVQQFMASVTISGGEERNLIVMVAIDSPRIIFALDHLFAIQSFITEGLATDEPNISDKLIDSAVASEDESEADSPNLDTRTSMAHLQSSRKKSMPAEDPSLPKTDQNSMSIAFRVNVVDAQIILIANPVSYASEAIVLGTKQVLMSQQHALTLQVSEVGMFLCRMDRFEDSRIRILDDFSLTFSMDSSEPTKQSIHIDLQPLVLRLSLRDILLALQIVSAASSSGNDKDTEAKKSASEQKARELRTSASLKKRTASGKGASKMTKSRKVGTSMVPSRGTGEASTQSTAVAIRKDEELTATVQGMRVILIDDTHELPILDLSVKEFTANARDWTSNVKSDLTLDMFINIFNFSKSAWEPLIEPWQLDFNMTGQQDPKKLTVEVTSKKTFELTLTSATIALVTNSVKFLSQNEDVLSKPRGEDAPYKVRNHTGFDIDIWADTPDDEEQMGAKVPDGGEEPWRFEDAEKMRTNLSDEKTGVMGVRLEASGFDSVNQITVSREGEFLYNLRPRKDQITHRLLVEVKLHPDNVKYITFRSPLKVENNTQLPLDLGVFDPEEGHLLKIEKIAPGESRSAPVGTAYAKSLLVRPDQGFGYAWSNEELYWKDLLKQPRKTLTCKGENGDKTPPFYFQMNAIYDRTHYLLGKYPHMTIRLSAPIELENLLPYDFKYRIFDKNTGKDWANFLRKGGLSPVHVVELSHLLLLNIDMQDTVFKPSAFSIINSSGRDDFSREKSLVCKDDDGLSLNLKLLYTEIKDGGGAFKLTVYSPYIILNKTGLDISVKSKSMLQGARTAAGQNLRSQLTDGSRRKVLPYMFAFGGNEEQRNRALIKVGESQWSRPQSFDAIGSTIDVVLPSSVKNTEIHIGISIENGEGKYKMTKVVTLAPRFVLKNQMNESIQIREPGSSDIMTLDPKALRPLHFLQKTQSKQLCLCFPGLNNQWSSPFGISELDTVHVKIAKAGQRQQLIRVDLLREGATNFLHLSIETKNWPFSMRNESDTEFMFFQSNPYIDEDNNDSTSPSWRPIRYRLPPRSIMPYAWDYPAALKRELTLVANGGRERSIRFSEIGNLIPMKIPSGPNAPSNKVIDLNITADGPTQTLVLSNYKQSKSMYKQKSGISSSTNVTGGFEIKDMDTDITFEAKLKLEGIGVSLVNAQLKELAYITLRDLSLTYSESPLYQTIRNSVKWVQIDNQLYGGIFPMILYPSKVRKTTAETEAHPSLSFTVVRVKDDSYGVTFVKYATLLLQEMSIEIDEDFLVALIDFTKFPGSSGSENEDAKLCDESLEIPEPKQQQSGQDLYFETLMIQPMQLDLSFVRTETVNAENKPSSKNPIAFLLNILTMAIGNVNDAPIRFNALLAENERYSMTSLQEKLTQHYTQAVLFQIHKVLGSADFLGNPVGLFNNLSSGAKAAFWDPIRGIPEYDDPEQFGIGIAKGATTFVKNSVFGVSDSFSKVTGSMAKGLAAATMDKQFQDQRRMTQSRNRPKHALYGVSSGANSLVSSLASGVGGLARKPIEGAEQEGFAGFFKGVGKGVIGLATKPAIGIFDLASNVSEGIRNTTTVFDEGGLDRIRLTRFVGTDGIVRPYNQREALGQFWLKQLDNGKYFNEEYIAHLELPREDVVVMLTYSRIMLVKSKRLTSEWDVPLKDIQTISKERTGLSLALRGGANGPFIPVAEESSRNFLYQKIGVAVREFNKKYKATE